MREIAGAVKEMDLEEEITLSKYIALTPLDLALICNQPEVVKLLVEHGVNLNAKNNPSILKAVFEEFLADPVSAVEHFLK